MPGVARAREGTGTFSIKRQTQLPVILCLKIYGGSIMASLQKHKKGDGYSYYVYFWYNGKMHGKSTGPAISRLRK